MGIRVYNTLTGKKDEFVPVEAGKVSMYSCGPTVYDYFHIGNARAFVVPDLIRKYFQHKGYEVTYVQNITDIEDKIIKRASDRGIKPEDIVNEFTKAFFDDRELLGVTPPDYQPRATEYVNEIIEMVKILVDKGFAYVSENDVYYDVSKFSGYGKLSKQTIEDLVAGARVDVGDIKDDPLDFALWKAAKPGEPSWESPWGNGRPGWHIECSAMSRKLLGDTFDMHCGGIDLKFPHHENEIAQTEGVTGVQFVNYWVHNGFVNINGQRMGKSLGNFKTIRDIVKHYPGKVIRYFLISTHYRKPINFSDEEMEMCQKALNRIEMTIYNTMCAFGLVKEDICAIASKDKPKDEHLQKALFDAVLAFEEHMDDDFNSAGALGVIHELLPVINTYATASQKNDESKENAALAVSILVNLCSILGFMDNEKSVGAILDSKHKATGSDSDIVASLMDILIDIRKEIRSAKMWALSDKIRDELKEVGILVEDTKEGARWKYEPK